MTIPDPGFGLPRDEARAARLAAWSRPATAEERTAGRASRRQEWIRAIAEGRRAAAAGHYLAAPSGQATGDGSVDRPWDLATALGSDRVRPGDTVWVAGGSYQGVFRCELLGEPQNEIVVRALPGERVLIDGGIRVEDGGHVVVRDFEVINSRLKRSTDIPGSDPPDIDSNDGIYVTAPHVKLINNLVHDTPQGIAIWGASVGSEVYGNLVFNNGWTGPDRTHGHGIYTQNNDPAQPKRIAHNVFANNYSYNVSCYGESVSSLHGFSFEENVSMNRRWLCGGETSAAAISLDGNHLFRESFELGYAGRNNNDIAVRSNIVVDGPLALKRWHSFEVLDNTVAATGGSGFSVSFDASDGAPAVGSGWNNTTYLALNSSGRQQFNVNGNLLSDFSAWTAATGFDQNGRVIRSAPSGPWIFLLPNRYEAGRGLIVVYNWNLEDEVVVDLAPLLRDGDVFAISNCLNPVEGFQGTYQGAPVHLQMAGWTDAKPMNDETAEAESATPLFGVFLVTTERKSADEDGSDFIPRPRNRN